MLLLYIFVAIAAASLLFFVKPFLIDRGLVGIGATIAIAGISTAIAFNNELAVTQVDCGGIVGNMPIVFDYLSRWFIVITNIIYSVAAIYSYNNLKTYKASEAQLSLHWFSFLLSHVGMLAVFCLQNMVAFLIGWEMMALGLFFLIIFESDKQSAISAGTNYFIQSHIAVLIVTAAFGWVYSRTGSMQFSAIADFAKAATPTENFILMMLFVVSFGFKADFVPFHTWLPHCHPIAPAHVSVLLSGIIGKAGIFAIMRMATYIDSSITACGVLVLFLGLLSGCYGILNAAVQRDYKRLLGYCTIENAGIMGMGIGIGLIGIGESNGTLAIFGFTGALIHVVNHACFKSLLFIAVGNVYAKTRTRNMEELGGLIKQMPQTTLFFIIGALAIGGLPPFGGFISEFIIYSGFLEGFTLNSLPLSVLMVVAGSGLAIIGGLSLIAFTKSVGVTFLGTPRKKFKTEPTEVSLGMRLPAFLLFIPIVVVMAMPAQIFGVASQVASTVYNLDMLTNTEISGISNIVRNVGLASLILLSTILLVVCIRNANVKRLPSSVSATWGCGYNKPIVGIQYTSKSFARSLVRLFKLILPLSKRYHKIKSSEIFPEERTHISVNIDFFEHQIIEPMMGGLVWLMNRFQFIQNGNLQRYIVYGLVFVLALIALATITR